LLTTENNNKKRTQNTIVDEWLVENFRNKLKKAAVIASALNKPLALYNNIIEESEYRQKKKLCSIIRNILQFRHLLEEDFFQLASKSNIYLQ
jgi:hypothetical protein